MKLSVFVTCVCAISLLAQTPALKNVMGEVAGVDASAKQIKLKEDNTGTIYTVNVADKTSLLRLAPGETDIKKASPITISDISAGDRMLARGPVSDGNTIPARTVVLMTKADIAKKQERDRAEWQRRGISGTVAAVNPDTNELKVSQRGRDAQPMTIDASSVNSVRQYAPGSIKFSDAKPSKVAEIKPGDSIRVLGEKSEDGTHFKAEEIVFGSFQTIAATISSIDAQNGVIRVQDLQTKKPVEIKITPDTMIRRMPEQMARSMAMRVRGGAQAGSPEAQTAQAGSGGPAPGGRGFGGRGGAGNFDLSQMLERLPPVPVSELKNGDAVIISSTKAPESGKLIAITMVAGVEPFLAAAPRDAGVINLGAWNLEGGIPEQ